MNSACILIVDDDEPFGQMLERVIIKMTEFRCFLALNAKEAFEILDEHSVDVVITDIKMPDINGLELTSIIKTKYESDIIVITGYHENFRYEDAIDFGANDFIGKPVRPAELILRLKRVLRERAILSQHKQTENELRKFKTIADESVYGATILDFKGNVLYCNRAFAKMHGYTPDEVIGEHFSIYHSELQLDNVNGMIQRLKRDGSFGAEEIWHKRKDNSEFPTLMTGTLIRDASEEPLYLAGMAIDITNWKNAEDKLIKYTEEIRDLYENAPCGYHSLSEDGTILRMNNTELEWLGYVRDEVIGKIKFSDFLSEEKDRFSRIFPVLKEQGRLSNLEGTLTRKDGSTLPVIINAMAVFDEKGNYLVSRASVIDNSERKQAEEGIRTRERELEAKSRNLEELNTALKVLLNRVEEDKIELEDNVLMNVKQLILPYVRNLKKCSLDNKGMSYVNLIESNLEGITSSFSKKLSAEYLNFTPKEIEIANLIKEGKTTKEIAEIMNISPGTIDFYRDNIRNKFNLKNKKINLRDYLLNLP